MLIIFLFDKEMLFCLIYIKVEQLQLTNNQINLLTVMQKWTFPKSQIYCDHPGIFHFFELISPWKSMFFPQFWCTPLEFQRLLLYPLEFSIDIFNRGGGYNFFFQAEDGIRDQPRSRGLGDVYKRQPPVEDINGKFQRVE